MQTPNLSRVVLGCFGLLMAFSADLFAQAVSGHNRIRNLRVAQAPDGSEIILTMDYHYNGTAGPIARIVPVIAKTGSQDAGEWFQGSETSVAQGQGPISLKVKFRKLAPGVPSELTTDQIIVRMLKQDSPLILATAAFPFRMSWRSVESDPGIPATSASPSSDAGGPDQKKKRSVASPDPEPAEESPRVPWTAKLKSVIGKLRIGKNSAPDPQNVAADDGRNSAPASQELSPPETGSRAASREDVHEPRARLLSRWESREVRRPVSEESKPSKHASAKAKETPPATDAPDSPPKAREEEEPAPVPVEAAQPRVLLPTAVALKSAQSEVLFAPENRLTVEIQKPASGSFAVNAPDHLSLWQQRLTLGPGDVLRLALFGEPETERKDVFILDDGSVSFLEAHSVPAAGLTVDELRVKLDSELSKYRRAPRTMISPVAFRSKKYIILGKIASRGVFTLDQPLTIIQAVARAKGLETGLTGGNVVELADLSRSFLMRQGKRFPINFEKLFQEGDLSQNVEIEPNDYLYFAASELKEIYVLGEVNRSGPVSLAPDLTVLGAIAAGGGFNQRAWQKKVLIIRGSLNQPETFVVNATDILGAKTPDVKLQSKDIVYVSARPWIKAEELLEAAATAFVQSAVVVYTGVHVTPINR